MLSWWVASDTEMLLSVDQLIQLVHKATFHTIGCVNQHDCQTGGSEQPNEIHEYVHGSAKVNVWCGLLCDCVMGRFFFVESTISGGIYQDMLENYFSPQIEDLERETGNLGHFHAGWSTSSFFPVCAQSLK
jgi:hypothetical protein